MAVEKGSWFFDDFKRIPDWKELVSDLIACRWQRPFYFIFQGFNT